MKHLIFITLVLLFCVTAYAKHHCQGFNNYDDRVTIVFIGDNAKNGITAGFQRTLKMYANLLAANASHPSMPAIPSSQPWHITAL